MKIGKDSKVSKSAHVGVVPLRKIKSKDLKIGNNAVCFEGGVIYLGSQIGDNLTLGHNAVIREENRIGNNFSLWSNAVVDYGCKIGNNVKVHCNSYVAQFTIIEDDAFLAPGVVITNDLHPGCIESKKCMKGPVIKKGAQIGGNCTILPRVTIGEGAMVGAGSTVTRDVPKNTVVCGNPARIICKISDLKCKTGLLKRYRKILPNE